MGGWEDGRMGRWVACSDVRNDVVCGGVWISRILFRNLRRGGGVAGWEDALYNPCIFLNDCSCGGVEGSEGINFLLKAIR